MKRNSRFIHTRCQLEMTNAEQKIKFVRLKNGDDIITEINGESASSIELKNPMMLVIDVDVHMNKQQIVMYNWLPQGIVKMNEVKISKRDVVLVADIEKDIEDHYKAVVFDLIVDQTPFKTPERVGNDKSGKIITFNKSSKDKPN